MAVTVAVRRDISGASRATARRPGPSAVAPDELIVLEPGRTSLAPGATVTLGETTTLGRSNRNTVVLDDAFVSGEHASIARREGALVLTDRGSTNGTVVNGRPVEGQVTLNPGDVIQIGEIRLQVGS